LKRKILFFLLISCVFFTQLATAAPLPTKKTENSETTTVDFNGEKYTYTVKTEKNGKKTVTVSNEDGTEKAVSTYNPAKDVMTLNGKVMEQDQVKGYRELSQAVSSQSKAAKEKVTSPPNAISADDSGPDRAVTGPPSGTSWSWYGSFTGKIEVVSTTAGFISLLLLCIPGGFVAAGWWSAASQIYAGLAPDVYVYYKSHTYRQWDTSLNPDQYMYWSSLWFYKYSNYTGYITGGDLKTYAHAAPY
jgi:hypothetical protein